MVKAIILAGGSGTRVGLSIPKQFAEVNGKPILVYTIDRFQKHPQVDSIVIVCISGWEQTVHTYISQYGFTKIEAVVTGSDSALGSIESGVKALRCEADDIIIVHDGVRPLVDEESISNVISDCKVYSGAISSIPLTEHVFFVGKKKTDLKYIPRENAFLTITPQAYLYSKIVSAYKKSKETGIGKDSPFIGTLMMDLGEKVCLSKGSPQNIKITSPKDLHYFESLFV